MTDTQDNGQPWLDSLAAELQINQLAGNQEITVPAVARECDLWSSRAPLAAWDRRDNAKSLLADWESAVSNAGPAVQRWLSGPISYLTSSLQAVMSATKSHRPATVSTLGTAVEAMLSQLVVPDARNAAWADIVEAVRTTDVNVLTVAHRVALLLALLDLCGGDPEEATKRMRLQLSPPPP